MGLPVPLKNFATVGGAKATKKSQLNVGGSVPPTVNTGWLATNGCSHPAASCQWFKPPMVLATRRLATDGCSHPAASCQWFKPPMFLAAGQLAVRQYKLPTFSTNLHVHDGILKNTLGSENSAVQYCIGVEFFASQLGLQVFFSGFILSLTSTIHSLLCQVYKLWLVSSCCMSGNC